MKLLVVSQYFYPENVRINTLCEELVRRGHSVTVLTGYPQYPGGKIFDGYGFRIPYEREWHGVHIERIRMQPRGSSAIGLMRNCLSFIQKGRRWVRRCKTSFDAVYVFGISPITVCLPAISYKKAFGAPMFFNVQDLWPENVEEILGLRQKPLIAWINSVVNRAYRASDVILCSSAAFVDRIGERPIGDHSKLVFWPQFCAPPQLDGVERPDVYTDDCFNIVFAGNLGDAQGLDLLVDAANRLRDVPVRFVLVGDGRAREHLEERVRALGLSERVVFVGRVSEAEANRYIRFADCAYLSFKKLPLFDLYLPAKLQSYLACGTPILVAAGGESARIVRESHSGFVCEQDVEALVTTIRESVLPSTELDVMRQNARRYFDEHFTLDRLVSELEEMMASHIGGQGTVEE